MPMPFLPALMKYSTSSSSECSVTSGVLVFAFARVSFGSAAVAVVASAPSADAAGSSASSTALCGRRDDNVAGERRDVAVVREQRAVLAGRDEVDADRVLTRIAAGPILDLELISIVLLVALHGHRTGRHRERCSATPSSLSRSAKYSRSAPAASSASTISRG